MERGYHDAEVDQIHRLLRELPGGGGETTGGAFVGAVTDAVDALLVKDVLAAEMFDALYGPVEPCIPHAGLQSAPAVAHTRWVGLN